jgi:hypothetical protein
MNRKRAGVKNMADRISDTFDSHETLTAKAIRLDADIIMTLLDWSLPEICGGVSLLQGYDRTYN